MKLVTSATAPATVEAAKVRKESKYPPGSYLNDMRIDAAERGQYMDETYIDKSLLMVLRDLEYRSTGASWHVSTRKFARTPRL